MGLETRFFADEINSQDISFDYETGMDHNDDLLSLNHLNCELTIPFQESGNGSEFMDTGLHSDSDTSSSSAGVVDSNWLNSFSPEEFSKFNPSDFPNLQFQSTITEEIKAEPISPLPASPYSSIYSPAPDNKTEIQVLDTPPFSPSLNSTPPISPQPSSNAEILKVITLNGNQLQLPNGAKLVSLVSSPANTVQNTVGTNRASIIQPKLVSNGPVVIKVLPSPVNGTAPKPATGQSLVLTAEEFATLTQQGLSKGTNELMAGVKAPRPLPVNGPAKPVVNIAAVQGQTHETGDMKALKRQQRMIKNRESACLSRKKKKEYVTSLEGMLSDMNKENQKLKQENVALRERVSALERECETLRSSTAIGSNTKKATALFAVLLVLSFNAASIGNVFSNGKPGFLPSVPASRAAVQEPGVVAARHRTGRSLLWNSDDTPIFDSNNNGNASLLPMCPMFNRTESSRIDSELRGWFHTPLASVPKPQPIAHETDSAPPVLQKVHNELAQVGEKRPEVVSSRAYRKYLLTPRAATVQSAEADNTARYISQNEVQVYESQPDRYLFAAFFEAIQRKDDTFYVVSFSGDHLLLPATEHNATIRPRMSLLLPAMPLNETMQPPPRHVSMMQIDCEVTNTRLLHISEDTIPPYYSGNRSTDRKADAGKRPWKKYKRGSKKEEHSDAIYAQSAR